MVVNIENERVEFKYEIENENIDEVFSWVIKNAGDLEEIIAILVKLILYLENLGYVATYKITPDVYKNEWSFGQGVDDDLRLSFPFPDAAIAKLVIEYLFMEIVPLEPLKDLASHNFISAEERRFRAQYSLAKIGIGFSIALSIVIIALNINSQLDHKNTAKESGEIAKKAMNSLKSINSSIVGAGRSQVIELKNIQNQNIESVSNIEPHIVNIKKGVNRISETVDDSNKILNKSLSKLNDSNNEKSIKQAQ